MRCGRVGWVGGGSARSRVRHLAWHVASWCCVAMQRATWPRAAERLRPLSRRTHSSARTNPRTHPHTTCTQACTRTQTRTQTRTRTTSSHSPGGSLRYASAAHTAQHIYQQSLPQRATSPVPHLHRDWAHPATCAPRPGSPPPHLHRDRDVQRRRVADYMRATKKTESSLPKTEIPLLRHEWTLAKNRFPVFLELPSVSVRRPGALPGFVRSFWGSPAVGAVLVCDDEARQRQRLLRPAVLLPAA